MNMSSSAYILRDTENIEITSVMDWIEMMRSSDWILPR